MQTVAERSTIAEELLKQSQEATREFFQKLKDLAYELRGDGDGTGATALGKMYRYAKRGTSAALAFLSGTQNLTAQLILADSFNAQFNWQIAKTHFQATWEAIAASPAGVQINHLQRDFIVSARYVSPEVNDALQKQVALDFEAVNRDAALITAGTFIGPQLPAVQNLVSDFSNSATDGAEIAVELLLQRGIIYSHPLGVDMFSSEKIEQLEELFRNSSKSGEDLRAPVPILTFREAALGGHFESPRIAPRAPALPTGPMEPVPIFTK